MTRAFIATLSLYLNLASTWAAPTCPEWVRPPPTEGLKVRLPAASESPSYRTASISKVDGDLVIVLVFSGLLNQLPVSRVFPYRDLPLWMPCVPGISVHQDAYIMKGEEQIELIGSVDGLYDDGQAIIVRTLPHPTARDATLQQYRLVPTERLLKRVACVTIASSRYCENQMGRLKTNANELGYLNVVFENGFALFQSTRGSTRTPIQLRTQFQAAQF